MEDQLNEQGQNPNGAPSGTGSFGGVAGLIPADQAGKPVDPAEAAKNFEEFKEEQAENPAKPAPASSAPTSQPTGDPTAGARISSRWWKACIAICAREICIRFAQMSIRLTASMSMREF